MLFITKISLHGGAACHHYLVQQSTVQSIDVKTFENIFLKL